MKKLIRRILSAVLVFGLLLSASSITAFAQGTTLLLVSKKDLKVGDTFTVTVTASEQATVMLRFSAACLTLSSAGTGTAEGNAVTFTGTSNTVTFSASGAGKADLIVSSPDGSATGCSTALNIAAADGAAPADTPAPAPAPEQPAAPEPPAEPEPAPEETPELISAPADTAADTSLEPGQVEYNGIKFAVSERYDANDIPAGFTKTDVSIAQGTYSELTNGTYTLVYLKAIIDGNMQNTGHFYIYDPTTGTITGKFQYLGSPSDYTMILPSDGTFGNADDSRFFSQASFDPENNGTGYTDVYQFNFPEGTPFFYFYGMKSDGSVGWFSYDAETGALSRADTALMSAYIDSALSPSAGAITDEETVEDEDGAAVAENKSEGSDDGATSKIKIVIIIFIVAVVFLLIINLIPKKKKRKKYFDEEDDYDDDEEDEEDDGYDEEEFFEEPKRKRAKALEEETSMLEGIRKSDLSKKPLREKTAPIPEITDADLRSILKNDPALMNDTDAKPAEAASAVERLSATRTAAHVQPQATHVQPQTSAPRPSHTQTARPTSSSDSEGGENLDVIDLNDL